MLRDCLWLCLCPCYTCTELKIKRSSVLCLMGRVLFASFDAARDTRFVELGGELFIWRAESEQEGLGRVKEIYEIIWGAWLMGPKPQRW